MTVSTPSPPDLACLQSGLVYRNPMPQLCSRHAYFPSVVQLEDGVLVCAMDIGSAFEALDVRTFLCRSVDGGQTWSSPQLLFEPDESQGPRSMSCRINRTGRGDELVGWVALFDRCERALGLANPANNGFVNVDFATVHSADGGRTWSPPRPVTLPRPWPTYEICYPPVPLGGGRMMVPASPWTTWEGAAAPQPNGWAWGSGDDGQTWTEAIATFPDAVDGLKAYEQKITRLSDGRVLVMSWAFDERINANHPNRYVLSHDGGVTFDAPRSTPLHGETCTAVGLDDNLVFCAYRRYEGGTGLWGHLARIAPDGQWIPLADQLLWAGPGYGENADEDGIKAMAQLRFGCPSVIRLQDGDVLVTFWAVEDCVSNIRWIRLRMI